MTKHQIESWAHRIIEQVKKKQADEDALVELKERWPEDKQTVAKWARRIAALANAAHGQPVLWLVGVNEETGPVAIKTVNMADWLSELQSHFSELFPDITDLNIPIDGLTVTALLIETDRAPYVIKNPDHGQKGGGPIALEVPWREGTKTRTARRQDLLKLLVPMENIPRVDIIDGGLVLWDNKSPKIDQECWQWDLRLQLYVTPASFGRIVFPFHRCLSKFKIGDWKEFRELADIRLYTNGNTSPMTHHTSNELILDGPGAITLRANLHSPALAVILSSSTNFNARLYPANSDRPLVIESMLQSHGTNDAPADSMDGPFWPPPSPEHKIYQCWRCLPFQVADLALEL